MRGGSLHSKEFIQLLLCASQRLSVDYHLSENPLLREEISQEEGPRLKESLANQKEASESTANKNQPLCLLSRSRHRFLGGFLLIL